MNRVAPLLGLLLIGMLTGTILSIQTNQILIPFIVQEKIVYNPISYLNNQTFYAGQTGTITLSNIMQADIYINSATITTTTQVFNTALGFTSLNFTLHFGSQTILLNALQNATKTLSLTQGIYPISLTIDYAASASLAAAVSGSAKIILTAQ